MTTQSEIQHGCSTALIVRDEDAPTTNQLGKQGRQEADAHQQNRDRASEIRQTWMSAAIVAAVWIFSTALLFDIWRDHGNEPVKLASDAANSSATPTREELGDERSFDFDDPSPITERMSLLHLIRYGGYATILVTGAREFWNRFTEEPVLSRGQMLRFEVMLDLHDQRIDGSVPDKLPRNVVETVMTDLRK